MRVNIDEIKEAGLDRTWDLPRETVDDMVQGDQASYRAKSPMHVAARLRKVDRRVLLDAQAKASLTAPCGRCLTQVEVVVPVDFEITFVPAEELEEAEGEEGQPDHPNASRAGSFDAEAADEEVYAGKVLELDPVVREQLLLALPRYPVCQEGCKGLCSVCGANLNERDCGCDRHVPDPRWAGLEKLKKKPGEE